MARIVVEVGSGKEAKAALDAISASVDKLGGRAKVLNGDLRSLDRQNASTERRFKSLAASLDPNIRLTNQYERAQRLLQRAMQQGIVTQREHDRLLGLARGKYLEASNGANALTSSFGKLSGVIGGLSLAALGRQLITTIADFEQLRARLETVTGSTEAAAAAFDLITDFAKTTPFSVQEITDSFVRLQAQGITPTREILLSFGNTAAAMGKSFNQFTEAVLDAATGEFERLKEFGIKAKSQGDQVTFTFRGMSTTVAKESGAIVGYLKKTGDTDFAGAMERQSQTLAGQFSNLKDAAAQLADALGSAGLTGQMKEALEAANNLVGGLTELLNILGASIPDGGVKSFLMELLKKASVLGMISSSINDIGDAVKKLNQGGAGGGSGGPFGAEADARWLKALSATIIALEEASAEAKDNFVISEKAMDAATDHMIEQAKKAKELAEETKKALENLVAMSHIDALPTSRTLDAGYLGVPENLQEEYQTYLRIVGVLDDYNSTRSQLNRLVEQGVISEEQAAAAIKLQADGMVTLKGSAEQVNAEWQKFVDNANENFLRGVQTAISGFVVDVIKGGEDAMSSFVDSLRDLLINLLAEYLAQWIVLQGKMLAASLARIGKEKAAQQAANAAGGGGGAGSLGSVAGMFGGGSGGASAGGISAGATAALAAVAVVVAVAAISKMQKDHANAIKFGTTASVGLDQSGAVVDQWVGKLNQTGQKAADAMGGLLRGLTEATGSFIQGMELASVKIRNDKKVFEAYVGNQLVGVFSDLNAAIVASVSKAFLSADLSRELDPAIEQVLKHSQGKTPEQLLEAVRAVQSIVDEVAGLTEIEKALRALPQQANALAAELQGMGVSMINAQRLASEWQVSQMQNLRDQITGHQRTAAEEMAERQRQAAMFNAELALMRAELEAKRASIAAKLAIVQAGGEIDLSELDMARQRVQGKVAILNAESDLYEYEMEMRETSVRAMGEVLAAAGALLQEQLAALDAILANLPAAIDPKEIKIGGGGGGGKAGKGGKVGGYFPKETLPTPEEARELVAQYLRTGFEQSLAEIRTWYAETIALYAKLGLAADEVDAAMEARLQDLGQQALAALGSPTVEIIQRFDQLREALAFLNENAEDLGISIEDLGQITEEVGFQMGLSLVDSLLQFVDNEDARRALEQARYEIEIANIQLQFMLLQEMGLLTEEMIAMIQGLLDELPDEAPSLGGSTATTGGGYYGGGYDTIGDNGDAAMERLTRALERLADYYEQLQQDETVSPLSLAERYALAEGSYQDLLAQIAAAQAAGDVELLADLYEQLPDVAQQYLELAAQMFGTSTQAYQDIFQAVLDTIEGYLGGYQEPDQWSWLQGDMDNVRVRLMNLQGINEETNNWLWNIRDILVSGGGSSSATSTATTSSAYSSSTSGPQIAYIPPPGPTGGPVIAAVPPTNTAGLERQVDQLRRDLSRAIDEMGRRFDSASDRRNRAAGGHR